MRQSYISAKLGVSKRERMKTSFLYDHPQHTKQIAQWYFDEWAYLSPTATVELVTGSVSESARSNYEFPLAFIVHCDNQLVGVAELKLHENSHYPELEHWLGGVYVPQAQRRKGVATKLIIAAQNHAQLLGIATLYLQCYPANIGLYEKFGFKVLHQEGMASDSVIVMEWPVNK